jgi:chemotaxis protein histidine kinase CheA
MDENSQEVIEEVLNGVGELVIINSGLSMFTEQLPTKDIKEIEEFILNVSSNFDQRLKSMQDTLLKIESIKQEIFEVLELSISTTDSKKTCFLIPMNNIKRVINPSLDQLQGSEKDCLLLENNAYSILDLEELFYENTNNDVQDSVVIITDNNLALKVLETGRTKQIVAKILLII